MIRRKALIVLWLSRSNLKLLMVSLTGLVIALSMLAGCMYYVEFARGDIYLSNFEDIEEEMDVVNFHYSVEPELEGITSIKNFLDNKIRELQLETLLKPVELSPVCYHSSLEASGYYGDSNFFHDYVSGFYGLNETILAECIPGSRFPANTSEILVYTPEAGIFDINSEFNLTVYRSRGNENHTVTITAIITDSTMKNGSIYQKLLTGKDFSYDYYDYLGYPGNEIRFFFPLDLYLQLLEELNLQRDRYFQIGFTYDIDLSGINQATVIAAVENFFVLEKAVYLRVYGEREYDYYDYYGYYYFNSDISWRLYESIFLVNSFIFIFAMLSIPVIVLAIVLVYFSLGILNDKRKKTVEMVKASGISGRFIFLSLFTELVILALAATAISMVVGIPLAFFTGTTSGFLSFTRPIDLGSYVLIIRPSTLQVLLVLGLILTFLTHFPAAIKLSRARVTRLESDTRQKRKRRRLRLPTGKTDILLLLAGFGGLFLFSFFNNLIWLLGPAAMSIYYIFMPFLLVLVILSPVFIVIGGVMIFNRIFMLFIPLMGKITWRRDWRLVATAFRQLNVNAKFAARTSLVLALGISFLIVIVVLPSSVMNYGEDSRYYSQGADIRIQLGDASEEETNGVMLALRNVTGLKSTSTIQMRVGTEVTQQDGDYDRYHYYARIYFLGIQQDFHEVAHWQSYYDDESLEDLVSSLYNSPELVPAIVDSNTVSFLEMINPLSVDLSYYNPVTSKNVEFKLSFGTITPVTTTEYFPSLMMYRYRNPNYMFYDNNIICKYSYITAIENSITEQNHTGAFSELYRQREIWGKILPGNDPLNVTGEIREILGELGYSNQQLSSLPERLEESNNSVTTVLLWLIVNYNLLGALAIVIACIILFVAARSSQNIPEVALGRSIGMKLHQLLLLIITEPFLLFFLSTLSGFIIAAFLLSFLVIPATGGIGYGPPFVYDYDLLVMLAFYGLMLLVLIVSGIVVSYLTIRTNISSMLKRDVIEYQRKSDTVQYGQLSRSKRPGKVTGKILVVLSKVSSRITAFAGTNKTALVKGKISAIYFISKSNLRLFTGSLLGLIIALSLLAGCLNYLEFSKPELYIDFFEKNHYNQMTFTAETIPNGSLTADRLRDHEQYLDQKILEYQLGDFLKKTPFMTTVILNENTEFQGHESYSLLSGYQESSGESILVDCVPGSSIPSGSDEVLVIAPVNTELFINEDINVNITLGSGYYKQVYQLDLTVTAILTDKTIRNDSAIRKHFSLESYHLLFPMKHFLELAQALQDGLAESIYDVNLLESFRYDIDHQGIDRAKAVQSVENLFLLLKELSVLSFAGKTPLHGDKSIIYTFAAWIVASNIFMPQFLLISIPVFVLVIILVLYSLGAINEKRMRAIIQTKTRGFSGKFVFIALLVETLILTLIATIASAMIGIPLAILMGTSSGFMTFTNDISDYVVIINPQTLVTLFVAGITFALLTHIISIVRLSRSPVVVLEEEAGKKNGRKGKRVLRSNLDVLLLVIGTLGLLILNVFMILLREAQKNYITPEYEMGPLEVFIPLIVVLVFVAPLFFLVGCILGYQRFIPYILRVFGRISWRYDWRLLASVMRNLSSNAKLTARTGLVLTIAVSFFVALVILPLSVQSYLTDSLYFTNGSDLSVSLLNLSEEEIIEIEASLQKIAGLEMTRVIRNSYRIDAFGRSRTAVLLGIQDDFHEVAHWKSYYDDESLNKLVSTLHGTGENNSIILVTRNSRMTLELLNTTEMRLDDYQGSYMIKPVAIADYFPGMTEFWNEEYYYAVCKYSFLNNLSTVGTNTQFKLWINVLPGYDPLAVSAQVRDNLTELGYPVTGVTSLPETIAASSDTRTVKLLWLAVNFSVIGTLAVVVSTVLLYSLASISRNVREIGLGRALGMKGHQLYMMMLSEPFILFILTGIPGGILAILLLEGLLATFGESIFWGVPFVLVMDWQLIIGIYGIIMLLMVTVGMSVSVKTERSNVARLLREE